jgi:rhodanese-related sulfurtransferase
LPYVDEYDHFLLEQAEWYTAQHLLDDMKNNENIYIVDLRTKDQFDEYHINLSESVPFHFVDQFVETFLNKKMKYIFLCSF